MNKKNQKGFTLVELIVVIAIVAILAAVGIVGYTQFISNARDSNAKTELDVIYNAMRAESIAEDLVLEVNNAKVTVSAAGAGRVLLTFAKVDANEDEGDYDRVFKKLLDRYVMDEGQTTYDGKFTLTVTGSNKGTLEYEAGDKGKASRADIEVEGLTENKATADYQNHNLNE